MNSIVKKIPAKINLSLDVLSKRDDGYHNLKMIMQQVSLCDVIEITKQESGFMVRTNLSYLPVNEKNIAYKSAQMFFEATKIKSGIKINITKNIPVAAGLAGGSTNSAGVFLGLNEMFGYPLTQQQLLELSCRAGTDVPYCILGGTMLAEERGEKLTKLPSMPDCYILLAKPSQGLSTRVIFGKLQSAKIKEHPDTNGIIFALEQGDLKGIAHRCFNVLETVSARKIHEIATYKDIMLSCGALGSAMTGSGSTVFGIFDDESKIYVAYEKLKMHTSDVYITKPVDITR